MVLIRSKDNLNNKKNNLQPSYMLISLDGLFLDLTNRILRLKPVKIEIFLFRALVKLDSI